MTSFSALSVIHNTIESYMFSIPGVLEVWVGHYDVLIIVENQEALNAASDVVYEFTKMWEYLEFAVFYPNTPLPEDSTKYTGRCLFQRPIQEAK